MTCRLNLTPEDASIFRHLDSRVLRHVLADEATEAELFAMARERSDENAEYELELQLACERWERDQYPEEYDYDGLPFGY